MRVCIIGTTSVRTISKVLRYLKMHVKMCFEELWTLEEVAEWLLISETKVYRMVRLGQIPCYRIGKLLRFDKKELKEWLQDQVVKPPKKSGD